MILSDFNASICVASRIWSNLLNLENNIGDINRIWQVIEKKQQQEGCVLSEERQALLLIDRFKFMDLFPCTSEELSMIGYKIPTSDLTMNLTAVNAAAETSKPAKTISPTNANVTKDFPEVAPSNPAIEITNTFNQNSKTNSERLRFPAPDTSKMYAFKPITNALCNLQPIPGGGPLLLPSIFSDFVKRLPPPHFFSVRI
jgi:cleavage stimulation factor subunit 3